MTLTLGWWLVPAIITALCALGARAAINGARDPKRKDVLGNVLSDVAQGLWALIAIPLGIAISSFSWLVWALLR